MLQALLALSSVRSQHPIVPSLRLTDAAQHPFITWIITSGASDAVPKKLTAEYEKFKRLELVKVNLEERLADNRSPARNREAPSEPAVVSPHRPSEYDRPVPQMVLPEVEERVPSAFFFFLLPACTAHPDCLQRTNSRSRRSTLTDPLTHCRLRRRRRTTTHRWCRRPARTATERA